MQLYQIDLWPLKAKKLFGHVLLPCFHVFHDFLHVSPFQPMFLDFMVHPVPHSAFLESIQYFTFVLAYDPAKVCGGFAGTGQQLIPHYACCPAIPREAALYSGRQAIGWDLRSTMLFELLRSPFPLCFMAGLLHLVDL